MWAPGFCAALLQRLVDVRHAQPKMAADPDFAPSSDIFKSREEQCGKPLDQAFYVLHNIDTVPSHPSMKAVGAAAPAPVLPPPPPATMAPRGVHYSVKAPMADKATVCCVPVNIPTMFSSLLVLASKLGYWEEVRACIEENCEAGERECLVRVLTHMMGKGIPLLLAVGRSTWQRIDRLLENSAKLYEAGSPLLLVDEKCPNCSVVALVQPMGNLVCVEAGREGIMPRELRKGDESATCIEMVTCILAVPTVWEWFSKSTDAGASNTVFAGHHFNFNWKVASSSHNATTYCPTVAFMGNMFPRFKLGDFHKTLGDYRHKLAAMTAVPEETKRPSYGQRGRPKKGRREEFLSQLRDSSDMWLVWRRALLLELVLTLGDAYGVGFYHLGSLLPVSMFGGAPKAFSASNPVRQFWASELGAGVGVERIWQVTAKVGRDEPSSGSETDSPRPAKRRK